MVQIFMNKETKTSTYECPSLTVIELCANDGVMQFSSPGAGGGEGIGGGTDL